MRPPRSLSKGGQSARSWFDKLTTNGMRAPVIREGTSVTLKIAPTPIALPPSAFEGS